MRDTGNERGASPRPQEGPHRSPHRARSLSRPDRTGQQARPNRLINPTCRTAEIERPNQVASGEIYR